MNPTERPLTSEKTFVLGKGRNFALTPSDVTVEYIKANVEAEIRGLPAYQGSEIRTEVNVSHFSARLNHPFKIY